MPRAEISHEEFYYDQFPNSFKWGSTASAYSNEGASNTDGRGPSWWDIHCQENSDAIADRSDGSVTSDSYHKFEDDVMLLKAMNANSYKFSISWSRILPDGTLNKINKAGIDFYDDIVNTLIENGIEPIVVLYHWDLPEALYKKYPSSWLDENVIKAFGNYAQLCYKKFGDRVKRWIPIFDPWTHSQCGFGLGIHPPCIKGWKSGSPSKAFKNLLKAHTLAYKIYQKGFSQKQFGKVGISLNSKCIPCEFSRIEKAFPNMSIMAENLPNLDPNAKIESAMSNCWSEVTKSPSDFIDLNQDDIVYSGSSSHHCSSHQGSPKVSIQSQRRKSITKTRDLLNSLKNNLGNPEVILCGKGLPLVGSDISNLVDLSRIEYFKAHANEVLKAVILDECNVIGYLPATLVDSFEFEHGYTLSYGLHKVHFSQCDKRRVQRSSAKYLAELFNANGFSPDWDISTIPLN